MRALCALALLALLAAPLARAADEGANPAPGPGPTPGPGCSMIKDKRECKHSKDDCVWCVGTFAGEACYSEDQAKFLPSAFFKCKPTPTEDLEGSDLVEGKKKKHDDDDKKPSCQDIKGRKDCIKSKAVCSWCENKYGPTMCIGEDQAKFLPPMVFDCEASRRSPDSNGLDEDDDDDESEVAALTAAGAGTLEAAAELAEGLEKKGDGGDAPSCRDMKGRKDCVKSKAVCSWCEGKYGPAMCLEEDQAKFLPPMAFDCEPSRRSPDGASDDRPYLVAAGAGSPEAASDLVEGKKKKHDDDDEKPSCQDMKGRKDCIKSKAVCSWCENKYGPTMCIGEDQAKFLPPMVFDCEASRRSPDSNGLDDDEDDEDDDDASEVAVLTAAGAGTPEAAAELAEASLGRKHGHSHKKKHDDDDDKASCRDMKGRKDCVKSKAVCSWCEGTFVPAMCLEEDQAKFLPPFVFSCEQSRRSKADSEVEDSEGSDLANLVHSFVESIRSGVDAIMGGGGEEFGFDEADLAGPLPGPTDPCTDYESRKKCGRHDGCTWCEGSWAAGQCFSEERAKMLPSAFFKCEARDEDAVASS